LGGQVWQNGGMMQAAADVMTRQDAILDAAFGTFAAYGFRRTTMEDIARAAGLSRTALYVHFRSKEDLFRSLTVRYFDQCLRDMGTALNAPGLGVEQALYKGFVAKDGKVMDVVLTTPHGAELLDAGLTLTADLVQAANARIAALLGAWLEARGLPEALAPAGSLAETIVAALMGLKSNSRSLADLRAGQAQLARLIARALD
jgi:AcrR family transcriptional regulator